MSPKREIVLLRARAMRWWPVALFAAVLLPRAAFAELDLTLGGRLQSNIRYRPSETVVGDFYDRRVLEDGFSRNEHILKLKALAASDRYAGVIDIDLVWLGFARVDSLDDLSLRERAEPVRIEAQSAFLEGTDLFVDGLDVRLGYQIVNWGVADQFNPTNNLNADDLEDRLLFGTQQSNLMLRADYGVTDGLTLSGVVVPIFRPALLPSSAPLAVAAVDRLPHLDVDFRHRLHAEAEASASFGYPTVVEEAKVQLPEPTADNAQLMLRAASTFFEQDVALSYYYGRSDFPVPIDNFTRQVAGTSCDPDDPTRCVDGTLATSVTLGFPRMQVAGLNVAGEIDALGWLSDAVAPIGYRLEVGIYFPEKQRLAMRQSEIMILGQTRPAGEYAYPNGERPLVLDDTPFAKWTLGLDYSFNEHVYLNVMWVHGLADEFGAGDFFHDGEVVREGGVSSDPDTTLSCAIVAQDGEQCAREVLRNRIGDYLVAGVDLRFLDGNLLFRMFTILELTGYVEERYSRSEGRRVRTSYAPWSADGFSAVLFPELSYNFGEGLVLAAGALFELGKSYTKFGEAAAGGSVAWFRGVYDF